MTRTMHIGEFKAKFSEVVELIKNGVTIKVIKGKTGELVGYFGKNLEPAKPVKRKLGFFNTQGVKINKEDLNWSDQELEEFGL
ncbi:hypothetical protein [Algoriphagus boritolerans]|uniref:Antitoxin component of toxin-antitoxin stability system, DNA-binding transcriptional repressor n=1 Tax=Algoriphagus boritolerans DSM 17298 = JCM 18970 TaxID=1120964 RepID=A0A1H5ZI71_9BACT|nr:hypothetical protein [Algoriphagus boritolerans]SEG35096.1 hypothetical protein SAMN03080598_03480 [Algoriphagus boritolerans DSM 17298 = JCM 18970]